MDKVEKAKLATAAKKEAVKAKRHIEAAGKKVQAFIKQNPEKATAISAAIGVAIGAAVTAAIAKSRKKK